MNDALFSPSFIIHNFHLFLQVKSYTNFACRIDDINNLWQQSLSQFLIFGRYGRKDGVGDCLVAGYEAQDR